MSSSADLTKGLEKVLRGNIELLPGLDIPKACLSVFLSSHAKDTHAERHMLREKVLPQLQERANHFGIKVSFSDMRYGAEDAFFDDHSTWIVCAQEIQRCARESDGLFFLSLQSCKYGYMASPKYIDKESLDARIRDNLSRGDEDCLRLSGLIKSWYQLDDNAVPSHYVLQALSNVDRKRSFLDHQQQIREYLKDIAFDPKTCENLFINRSIIEWETKFALELDPRRCFWLHREFAEIVTLVDDPQEVYSDTATDASKKLKLEMLKSYMEGTLTENSISKVGKLSLQEYLDHSSEAFRDYSEQFTSAASDLLTRELNKVILRQKRWLEDGCGIGIQGNILNEVLVHQHILHEKLAKFEGREALVREALSLIDQHPKTGKPTECTSHFYQGINLAVMGSSGSGRTGLMAKLFQELHKSREKFPILIRFCGHSSISSDGFKLVLNIIHHIQFLYQLKEQVRSDSYDAAVTQLQDLLRRFPLTLLIDGLDQLSDAFEARSRLTFLLTSHPFHEHTKVIVSTAPDIFDEQEHCWIQCFRCATRLKEANVPILEIDVFEQLQVAPAHFIVQRLLQRRGRRLTEQQKLFIDQTVLLQKSSALYLNLIVRLASEWTSDIGQEMLHFGGDSDSLLNQILDKLETQFGKQLVRHAIGFITFARQGIEDKEMTDLLSLSEEVLREVYQKLQPEGSRRVHYPVWLKLRTFLQGLIVKSDSNCWIWYHRKLKVIAERRFVEVEKVYYHSLMGKYFSDTLEQSQYEGQSISHQPLTLSTIRVWFPEAQINTRRCIESTHHLLLGRRLREAASELCNLEYVCACVLAGEGFQVVENISKLHEDVNNKLSITGLRGLEAEIISKLCQYQRWLCQNMKDIVQDPRGYISLSVIRQPVASTMKIEIDNMLQQTASNIISSSNWSMNSWVRGKPMGQLPHQSFAVLLEIVGHNAYVHDVQWTTNSYRIISASEDCTIKFWNGRTGRLEYSLLTEEPVHRISTSPNGRLIAIFSGQCTLKVCDAETGRLFHSLKAHRVKALSWHADSSKLICTENSDHVRYTRIFNLKTGKQHTTMLGESKALAWSRKGDKLASAAFHDNCVKIWDAQEYVLLQSLEGHFKTINALSWNPAGTHIVSAADDCTARIWNVSECALVFMLKDSSPIVAVRWSTDGQRVATASVDAMIKIWDTFRGRLVKTIKDSSNVAITSLDWSPDCSFVVSGSRDGTLKTWGISNGDQLESYLGHEQCVNHVAWAPKGTAFASASDDGCIKLWDKGSTQVLKSFRGHNSKVFWVSWCLSGEKLYSAGEDNTIRVWDVKNGTELQCISCDNAYAVLVDSNQTFVAVTEYRPSNDSTKLFDVATGKLVSTLEGPANSISWAPDGGVIAIGGANTSIYLCFGESGVVFRCWKAHTKTITATAWSPNGSMLASASEDMTIKLWDASSSSILVTLEDHETSVCHICWSPDTETLATACADFSVKIWNTMDRKMTHRLTGHKKLISALRWCPFSSKVVSSSFDKSIKIWDVGAEETLQQSPEGHNDWVCHVGWNSDGTQLLSSSKDKTIKVWDVETRSILQSNIAHDDVIDFVEFDHLDRFILSCSQDKSLKLWEKDTFRLIQTIQQPYSPAYVVAACWNPSGTMIAYCTTDNTINIWEVKSKQITNTFLLDCAASSIQWSSDNTKLATGSDDKKIDVWDAESGVLLRPMENVTSSIICVSWSPDCNKIAAGSRSPVLQVWNAQSGKVIHALTGHFGWISSVAWSGDGTTLVSGSWDKSVCVWQTDTGQLLKTLHGHNGPVFSVSWHPNSCKIASASADSTIVVWETVQQGHNNQHGWIH